MSAEPVLTVYCDGACTFYRREFGFYRGCCRAGTVAWVDVAKTRQDGVGLSAFSGE